MLLALAGACLLLSQLHTATSDTNLDDLIKQVFGPENTTSLPDTNRGSTSGTDNGGGKDTRETDEEGCVCVPYYLCANGTVVTDGTGLLDIRAGTGTCKNYMDRCCKEPLDGNKPIKPKPTARRGCGQRHPDGVGFRITGDSHNEAQFGEFPWMVALLKKTLLAGGEELMVYQCGGALIHEQVVLTAAHCVLPTDDSSQLEARVGEWDTQTANEIYPHQNGVVKSVIAHPNFKRGNLHNDYALLILDKPVVLGENVDTICLPTSNQVPLSRECYATGWGKNEFGEAGSYQVILKKIDLPIVPKGQCIDLLRKTRLGPYYRLHDSFVCAGGIVGKDTCKGDGGSPLACPVEGKEGTYEVTGLVSWGIGCGNETPGVYAGVAYAMPWIKEELRKVGISIDG